MRVRFYPLSERGLTLVELLLALALTGLMAAAILNFYYCGVRTWQRDVARMDLQQNARAAAEMIDRELRFARWVNLPRVGEIRYKLKGDLSPDSPDYYRCFTVAGSQLIMEEIRNKKGYAYNVVALGIREVRFSLDTSNNVNFTVTAGGAGDSFTLSSSVQPRNLSEGVTPP